MKATLLLLPLVLLSACQTVRPPDPDRIPEAAADAEAAGTPSPAIGRRYTIGARMDPMLPGTRHDAFVVTRNEAGAVEARPTDGLPLSPEELPPPAPSAAPAPETPPPPTPPPPDPKPSIQRGTEPARLPNGDGLIDLTALPATSGDETNPFAVRHLPAEAIREVPLHLQGIVAGAVPCAVVNGRVVQPEESLEGFTVVRVEPESVLLRFEQHLLRLPISPAPVRVRFAP